MAGTDVHNAVMNRLYPPAFLPRCFALALLAMACGSLPACKTTGGTRGPLGQPLYEYAGAIRWNDFENAWSYVDPKLRDEHPLTDLEMERYKQIQVTDYQVVRVMGQTKSDYEQVAEIHLVNRHTQVERVLTDHQRWHFDADTKQWWLVSGLPKIVND